jgi:tRNA(Ile)-lysidine synthase
MSVVTDALRKVDWSGRHVLVACSGGVDSIVLLHALVEIGLKPDVLHVNYQLRGEASERDRQLVEETAQSLGVTCRVHLCPVERTKRKGVNLQSEARAFRRELFGEWTGLSANHVVILAHHADDQLETFFLQWLRGSGTFGLGGMHPERDQLLRPFLALSKQDLIDYARDRKIAWREDQSNTESNYLRNVFRNRLLPELTTAIPSLKESALVLMEQFRLEQRRLIDSLNALLTTWEESGLPVAQWLKLSEEQKLAFAHEAKLPAWTIRRLDQLADGEVGNCFLAGELTFRKSTRDVIRKVDRQSLSGWDYKIEEVGILPSGFDKQTLYLDADKVIGEIVVRSVQTGDRIRSIGMKGSQLVSDVLKDAGIPVEDRRKIPILADNEHILWIPGIKVGRSAIAGSQTRRILKVSLETAS